MVLDCFSSFLTLVSTLANTVFGSSEYLFFSRSFIIMLGRWESITIEVNLITFRGIHSGPAVFLGFKNLMIKLISSTWCLRKSNGAEVSEIFFDYDYTWMILIALNDIALYIYHGLDLMDFL